MGRHHSDKFDWGQFNDILGNVDIGKIFSTLSSIKLNPEQINNFKSLFKNMNLNNMNVNSLSSLFSKGSNMSNSEFSNVFDEFKNQVQKMVPARMNNNTANTNKSSSVNSDTQKEDNDEYQYNDNEDYDTDEEDNEDNENDENDEDNENYEDNQDRNENNTDSMKDFIGNLLGSLNNEETLNGLKDLISNFSKK